MVNLVALLSGLIFGLGLLLSGLANPAKVLGFLDLAGGWDPSLALVMGGAIGVGLYGFDYAKKLKQSALGQVMHVPHNRVINRRLIVGSLIFGGGWGLTGICPGPAVVALGALVPQAAVFVLAMVATMALFAKYEQRKAAAVVDEDDE